MADASAVFTPNADYMDVTERFIEYYGTVAIDAAPDTYPTGGLTLSLTGANIMTNDVPHDVRIWTDPPIGWLFGFDSGTTIANGKILVFGFDGDNTGAITPLDEIANGTAIPAAVSGATIKCSFKVRKGR